MECDTNDWAYWGDKVKRMYLFFMRSYNQVYSLIHVIITIFWFVISEKCELMSSLVIEEKCEWAFGIIKFPTQK
jgi:hypothetical protein